MVNRNKIRCNETRFFVDRQAHPHTNFPKYPPPPLIGFPGNHPDLEKWSGHSMKWYNNYNKSVLEPRVSPAFVITSFCNHCDINFMTRDNTQMILDLIPVKIIRVNLPKDDYVQSHENTSDHLKNKTNKNKTKTTKIKAKRSITPYDPWMTFDPTAVEVTCVTHYPRIIGDNSHGNTSKYVDILIIFQNFKTHRLPLILLQLLRSHVQLYPRILLSKFHGNTFMYVDTVTIFKNYAHKVNDPITTLDDLWHHFCWGYTRYSTQETLTIFQII